MIAFRAALRSTGTNAVSRRAASPSDAMSPRASLQDLLVWSMHTVCQKRPLTAKSEPQSNRAAFKVMPVNPKVLEYIERIGVGIPRKQKYRKRQQRPKKYSRKHDTTVLDTQEELDFFRQRRRNIAKERTRKRPARDTRSSPLAWLPPPPFASTPDQVDEETTAAGYKVKRRPVQGIGWVGSLDESFPKNRGLPEVALAGRSNVGKSTLLNALLYGNQVGDLVRDNRRGKVPEGKKLPKGIKAVTSDRPGETRKITFYQLSSEIIFDDKDKASISILLVDLPGYGFAFASEEKADEWKALMKNYIVNRGKSLKRVLLLIDARHGMKKADRDFLESLEATLYSESHHQGNKQSKTSTLPPIQLVLTKCDLVSQVDLARRAMQVKEQLSDCLRREPSALPVMLVSAKPGVGFNNVRGDQALGGVLELQREIAALAPQPKRPAQKS